MEKVFITDKQGNKVLPKTHVSAVYDDEGNDLGSHLGAFEDEVRGLVDTPHQEYVTVATYASLPQQGSKDTIYRVSNYDGSQSQVDDTVYSEYAWDGSQYVFLCVKSQIGEVFDISAYHNNATYADLNTALTGNTGGVPSSLQKGGMSVKFVQSYDNKYVQFCCKTQSFSLEPEDWYFCCNETSIDNPEFIDVVTDKEGKLLEGIRCDGTKYIAGNLHVEGNVINEDFQHLENDKVDKVEGKSLINSDIADSTYTIENPEWLDITIEKDKKILSGIRKNGNSYFAGIESPTINIINSEIKELYNPSDILNLNPKSEILPVLKNYKFHLSNVSPDGVSRSDYQNLSLLWFSDIHSDGEQLKRIMKFYNEYQDLLDDAICTGDVVYQTWQDDFTYWHKNGGDRILFVNGNHDTYKPVGGTIKTYYSAQAGYGKYIEPFLASTQYTECPEGKMYWVKDYPQSKIRIITVDVMHLNERYDEHTDDNVRETGVYQDGGLVDNGEQMAWFIEKLAETLDENNVAYGYQVICTAHFPAPRNEFIQCTFSTLMLNGTEITGQLQQDYQSAVQDFIDNGGEFICWMCGHHHQDEFFLSLNYPNQLCVAVDCSQRMVFNNPVGTKENTFQTIVKPDNTKARDSFNIISIEPKNGYLRLYRVGAQYDAHNRRMGSLVYDYKNKKLIYN